MGNIFPVSFLKSRKRQEQSEIFIQNRRSRLLFRLSPLLKQLFITDADASNLYDLFSAMDLDRVGMIKSEKFFNYFHIDGTKLVEAIFFDFNFANGITFPQFMVMMYFFCSANDRELAELIFFVYDINSMGKLYEPVVHQVIRDMYYKSFRTEPHATGATVKLLNMKNKEMGLNVEKFCSIIMPYDQPAAALQATMRRESLDPSLWKRTRSPDGKPLATVTLREAVMIVENIEIEIKEEAKAEADTHRRTGRDGDLKPWTGQPSSPSLKDSLFELSHESSNSDLLRKPICSPMKNKVTPALYHTASRTRSNSLLSIDEEDKISRSSNSCTSNKLKAADHLSPDCPSKMKVTVSRPSSSRLVVIVEDDHHIARQIVRANSSRKTHCHIPIIFGGEKNNISSKDLSKVFQAFAGAPSMKSTRKVVPTKATVVKFA